MVDFTTNVYAVASKQNKFQFAKIVSKQSVPPMARVDSLTNVRNLVHYIVPHQIVMKCVHLTIQTMSTSQNARKVVWHPFALQDVEIIVPKTRNRGIIIQYVVESVPRNFEVDAITR
jgi:hypothetical protein